MKKKTAVKYCSLEETEQLNSLQVSLQAILSRTAEKMPEKIAVRYGNQKFTYRQLNEFSSRLACALVDCGVKEGCRVALFLPNIPQFVIAYFGVLKVGGVVTVVSPLHKELEVERQLCDSGAQTIVVLKSLYPIVKKVRTKTLLKNVIVTDLEEEEEFKVSGVRVYKDVFDFWGLIGKSAVVADFCFRSGDDLAVLQYTSGTAGVPKGVMLSHINLVSNALSFASWIKGTSSDTFLAVLPFSHVYGMTTSMLTPISLGAEIVLMPRFNPVKCLHVIERCGVTVFCGSPTMFNMLLGEKFEKYSLSSVRVCISGASMLPRLVQKQFMRAGVFLVEGYGLTETSPVTHCTPVDKLVGPVKIGSVGLALPGTETRIVDVETGCIELGVGKSGELCVRGLQVMLGYWRNQAETERVFCDGWLFTGDIAFRDSDGYVYIVDRKKDLIKHKDYSVCPRELEDVLCEHPAVKMCVVVGKPDVLVGEVPKAFVVLKEEAKTTAEAIISFVNGKVANYKALAEVEFCRELPYSVGGKVLRWSLKEER